MSKRVGIRDLKQNASAIVRQAASGETIEITDRGRAVARIGPLPSLNRFDQMLAEGRITLPQGDPLDIVPLPPVPGGPLGTEALHELRADER